MGVARAHHLGHVGAPPTETSILRKGGRGHAISRARARHLEGAGARSTLRDQIPTKKIIQKVNDKDVEVEVRKPKGEWTDEDWKKMSSSNKAINFLHYALTQDVYIIISSCETAKEIWDKLNVAYEEDKKHKAYVSRKNEDDSSTSSNEDEDANICLITSEDEVNDSNSSNSELQDAYDKLLEEFVKLTQKHSITKKKNVELQKENEFLKNENVTLGKVKTNSTNDTCKFCKDHINEIEILKSSLTMFNASSKNLDKLLSSQKHAKDKEGIGYNINKLSTFQKGNKVTRTPIRQPQSQKHASNFRRNKNKWQLSKHASYRKQ
ncbi:hypothetical protein PIB30_034869 [Stylosanthes scabra]|uniref:Uncharacterized protein n=1 Tax=Stylosanthes scabra TaxID=79078 RepID=A0ABU6QCI7_9FABA|nr:hypothetical protein [Stylosanthes scabra]